jgi:hypothetical protein
MARILDDRRVALLARLLAIDWTPQAKRLTQIHISPASPSSENEDDQERHAYVGPSGPSFSSPLLLKRLKPDLGFPVGSQIATQL